MGNLVIRKVLYKGDQYYFESPEFQDGINIIVGDNGSGKSTFSYFIEYGLGGYIRFFKRDNMDENYSLITKDSNNFVELYVEINNHNYVFKRFIGMNDIFVKCEDNIQRFSVNRNSQNTQILFSDWLLNKLGIKPFELNLGTYSWIINFSDLYRLLNYDQDTPPAKVYKAPASDNFINDSILIRKTIFETLIGLTSQEYNDILGEVKVATKKKNDANALLVNFLEMYPNLNEDYDEVENSIHEFQEQLNKLYKYRDTIQRESISYDEKIDNIGSLQERITYLDLKISEETVKKRNLEIEKDKIANLVKDRQDEISLIEKIVFTHDKLDLFSLETCPFCGTKSSQEKGFCICGAEIKNTNYEKFVYSSNEYKDIISYKKKSLETIESALRSYDEEIQLLNNNIEQNSQESFTLKDSLRKIISRIEYSGNSDIIDQTNQKIIEIKDKIFESEQLVEFLTKKKDLQDSANQSEQEYKIISERFKAIQFSFERNNKETIRNFNRIFNELMKSSTCDCTIAEIDEDYIPIIDKGEYKEKSAKVPIRLMYYFSFFCMGLKYENIKHPRFLMIDTPEAEGIDEDNLKVNLLLLDKAIRLAEEGKDENSNYQVIMTTGYGKYPDEYEKYVLMQLKKKDNLFILQKRGQIDIENEKE